MRQIYFKCKGKRELLMRLYLDRIRRLMPTLRTEGEDLGAGCRYPHRMLELRRKRTVPGDCRPAVGQHFHIGFSEINHRLNGEDHPRFEDGTLPWGAIVKYVGLVVENETDAVTAEVPDDAAALGLRISLYRGPDISHRRSRLNRSDAAHHGFVRDVHEALRFSGNAPGGVHTACVAMPAVEDKGDIDIQDVALNENPRPGNAVTDHMIEGYAAGFWVAAIVQRGGHGAVVHRKIEHQPVD